VSGKSGHEEAAPHGAAKRRPRAAPGFAGPWKKILPLGALAAFGVALWILHRTLREYRAQEVLEELSRIPAGAIAASCVLTALAYISFTGYDALAVRYIGGRLPYRHVALASFIAYGFSNNFALGGIASTTLRYRLYSAWGLTALDVGRIFLFCLATAWLGYVALAGAVFAHAPPELPAIADLPVSTRFVGISLLAVLAAFGAWSAVRPRTIALRGFELPLPGPRLLLAQIAVSSLDWALSAGALFALLPSSPKLSYLSFLGVFLLAQVLATASHVPGGLGVLEGAVVYLIAPDPLPADAVLGSLLAFRGIYYVAPMLAAGAALAVRELLRRRRALAGEVLIPRPDSRG